MEGVATPLLLVEAGSPHTYSLKPSQARYLQDADAVFWVAHDVETFLEKPLESIPKDTVVVELGETKGLVELSLGKVDRSILMATTITMTMTR